MGKKGDLMNWPEKKSMMTDIQKKAKVKQNVRVFRTSSEDTVLMKQPKSDGQERQLNVKVHYKRLGLGHE